MPGKDGAANKLPRSETLRNNSQEDGEASSKETWKP